MEKLEEELADLKEKCNQERTEEVYKEYFEAAGYLRAQKDEWMMLENKRLEAENNLKETAEDKGGEEENKK